MLLHGTLRIFFAHLCIINAVSNESVSVHRSISLEGTTTPGTTSSSGWQWPAYSILTLLSWGVMEFEGKLSDKGELGNALAAVRWVTDYLVRAHPEPEVLCGEFGYGNSDHACWQHREDMTAPRIAYKISNQSPSADLAGKSAGAPIAFQSTDPSYSNKLLTHARQVTMSAPAGIRSVVIKIRLFEFISIYFRFVE